jgi:hypothetical protein
LPEISDPDGDSFTFTAVSSPSQKGGLVTLTSGSINYLPPTNYSGTDLFYYTVTDDLGSQTTSPVLVQISGMNAAIQNLIGGIQRTPTGILLRFAGVPGRTYHIERTQSLVIPTWIELGAIVAPPHGLIEFQDNAPPAEGGFYRSVNY